MLQSKCRRVWTGTSGGQHPRIPVAYPWRASALRHQYWWVLNAGASVLQKQVTEKKIDTFQSNPFLSLQQAQDLSQSACNVTLNDQLMRTIQTNGTSGKWITQKTRKSRAGSQSVRTEAWFRQAGAADRLDWIYKSINHLKDRLDYPSPKRFFSFFEFVDICRFYHVGSCYD